MRAREISKNVSQEFEGVSLADARLTRRLGKVVERLSSSPAKGFPQLVASDAELEALYRFLGNERVQWEELIGAHLRASAERARGHAEVVIAHDTTILAFGGKARVEEVGRLEHDHPGFFGHFALVVTSDDTRAPLGVVGMQPFGRGIVTPMTEAQRRHQDRTMAPDEKESCRWAAMVDEVSNLLGPDTRAIHVMDREAD